MTASIATNVPAEVVAGDTIKWTCTTPDYPASEGWALAYRFINPAGTIDVNATATGADHLVVVPAAASANWPPGTYAWAAYVSKGGERFTVGGGTLVVKPDLPAQLGGLEARSSARVILEQLEAAFRDYVANKQGLVAKYEIGARSMSFRSSRDFITQIEYWRKQAEAEAAAESIAKGLGNPRRLYARF